MPLDTEKLAFVGSAKPEPASDAEKLFETAVLNQPAALGVCVVPLSVMTGGVVSGGGGGGVAAVTVMLKVAGARSNVPSVLLLV
jgi:hypothetical protein